MALQAGVKVGAYEIISPLGAGGMGEVYRARDTRLEREVAIKILPDALARDGERVLRFEREAKLLASLNHSNIGQIYGFEGEGNKKFLVLEYVEGETLAQRLKHGPLPVDETLEIGKQIAEALETAHEKGIIHRDLKPGNVMVRPDGAVKVLDFGLARAMVDDPQSSGAATANSPTVTVQSPAITGQYTRPGVVLGTAAYVSPEQARGKQLDKRTDIWSFGVVLFECLSGRRPFEGDTTSDLVARILEREPDWTLLPASTPPLVQLLLRRCLAKDQNRRLRDIGDARVDVESAVGDPTTSGILLPRSPLAEPRTRRRLTTTGAAALAIAVGLGAFLGYGLESLKRGSANLPVVRFSIDFPESDDVELAIGEYLRAVAMNRAGTLLAYTAHQDHTRRIFLRPLESGDAQAVPGTDGGHFPFFSPDGRWLGYWHGNQLMRVPVSGGPPLSICDAAGGSLAWLDDGSVVFTAGGGDTIQRVDARGGSPQVLAKSDRHGGVPGRKQLVLGFDNLHAVPNAPYLLAGIWDGTTIEDYDVVSVSLEGGSVRQVVANANQPQFVAPDRLVFHREGSLFWAPFDAEQGKVIGEATLALRGVRTGHWADTAQCAVSPGGTLAFVPGGRQGPGRRLVRVDATGRSEPLMDRPDSIIGGIRVSPDETAVALMTLRRKIDLWTFDLTRRSFTLVEAVGESYHPVWLPNGRELVYQHLGGDSGQAVVRRPADSAGQAQVIASNEPGELQPSSVSPDGKVLLLTQKERPQRDIVLIRLDEGSPPKPLLATAADEGDAMFSPDGKWYAYESNETGRYHVYVRAFPDSGRRWQVSRTGGYAPRWSRGGDKLYFLHQDAMHACTISTESGFAAERPEKLFDLKGIASLDVWGMFDVLSDGSFVMVEPAEWEKERPRIEVVVNWAAELRKP